MKNIFKSMAAVVVCTLTFAACNNNNTETVDTLESTTIEQVTEDEIVAPAEVLDTTPVVEEQQTPAPTKAKAKTTAKKAAAAPTATKTEEGNTTIQKTIPAKSESGETTKVTTVKRKSAGK